MRTVLEPSEACMHHKVIAIQLARRRSWDLTNRFASRSHKDFTSQSGPTPVLLSRVVKLLHNMQIADLKIAQLRNEFWRGKWAANAAANLISRFTTASNLIDPRAMDAFAPRKLSHESETF